MAEFKEKVVVPPTKKCVFDPFEKAAPDLGSDHAKLQEMNELLRKENTELFRFKEFAQHLEKRNADLHQRLKEKKKKKKSQKMGKDLEKLKCTLENTRQRLDQTKSKLSKLYKTFNKSGKPKYVMQTMKRRNVQLNCWRQKSKQLVLQEQLRRNPQASVKKMTHRLL